MGQSRGINRCVQLEIAPGRLGRVRSMTLCCMETTQQLAPQDNKAAQLLLLGALCCAPRAGRAQGGSTDYSLFCEEKKALSSYPYVCTSVLPGLSKVP